jgi:methylenetetrahydrofolate reductase (NADPH)
VTAESRLERLVRSGTFVVTAEVVPPRSADGDAVRMQARELVGYADAVNVTDNPRAAAHMSPVAGAALVAAAGLEPTLQLTCRDRNRLGLTSDLLGGWALGARNLFCLTGDPVGVGDHPDTATVNDVTVEGLVRLADGLREDGRLLSGAEVEDPPRFYVGVADVPLAPSYDPARLEGKLDAGARFVMTQIVYDVDALETWLEIARARGVVERAALIAGVAPLSSAKQARFLDEKVPGVTVPPELVRALEEAGDEAAGVGVAQCVEVVRRLRSLEGIAGVHIMGMGHEEGVRAVVEGAALLPRPALAGP